MGMKIIEDLKELLKVDEEQLWMMGTGINCFIIVILIYNLLNF